MKERYYLYQRAKTANGMLYDMEQYMPYHAETTKESVQQMFASLAPADIALGSIAKFHSEDENGARFDWTFEYEQNEELEKMFMLISETYIDRVPVAEGGGGGDLSTAEVTFVDCNTEGSSSYDVVCPKVEVESDTISCGTFSVNNTAPKKVSVPLYKNSLYLDPHLFSNLDYSVMPTTEGDIEFDSEKIMFHIYGNGTITLKGEQEA